MSSSVVRVRCRPRKGFWRRTFKRCHFAFQDTTLTMYRSAADMKSSRPPAHSLNVHGLAFCIDYAVL